MKSARFISRSSERRRRDTTSADATKSAAVFDSRIGATTSLTMYVRSAKILVFFLFLGDGIRNVFGFGDFVK